MSLFFVLSKSNFIIKNAMKKILLAFAENKLPESAFEFVRRLNEINPLLVTGIFLGEVVYSLRVCKEITFTFLDL